MPLSFPGCMGPHWHGIPMHTMHARAHVRPCSHDHCSARARMGPCHIQGAMERTGPRLARLAWSPVWIRQRLTPCWHGNLQCHASIGRHGMHPTSHGPMLAGRPVMPCWHKNTPDVPDIAWLHAGRATHAPMVSQIGLQFGGAAVTGTWQADLSEAHGTIYPDRSGKHAL